jgi:RimJ/RimL family protein N-acetyltransferase
MSRPVAGDSSPGVERFDEVRTPRLLLRRWRPEDLQLFARMNADPEVMRYFPAPRDEAASNALVELLEARFETQGYGLWAVERLVEGDFIGFTGLNPLPPGTPGGDGMEVGWRLAAHAWGHGYATEAARAALEVGLVGAGLPEIWSITAVLNLPSQAVMRRVGLRFHSQYEHPGLPIDHPLRPHVAYRIASRQTG